MSAILPCVTELFPQLLDEGIKEDDTPSCSVRMSLASQGLFVNDIVVFAMAPILCLGLRARGLDPDQPRHLHKVTRTR